MLHTRHFMLLLVGVVSAGFFAVSLIPEDSKPRALLSDPIFVSPEEAYAVVPSDFFADYREKDAFVARVRSRLIGKMAVTPLEEMVPVENTAETLVYPNTTPEALAYEEVTESAVATSSAPQEEVIEPIATTSVSSEIENPEPTATTSPVTEEVSE